MKIWSAEIICLTHITMSSAKLSEYLKEEFDSVLNTVILIVIFTGKAVCGDRTGSDRSHICGMKVVLCPGSINQPPQ